MQVPLFSQFALRNGVGDNYLLFTNGVIRYRDSKIVFSNGVSLEFEVISPSCIDKNKRHLRILDISNIKE